MKDSTTFSPLLYLPRENGELQHPILIPLICDVAANRCEEPFLFHRLVLGIEKEGRGGKCLEVKPSIFERVITAAYTNNIKEEFFNPFTLSAAFQLILYMLNLVIVSIITPFNLDKSVLHCGSLPSS